MIDKKNSCTFYDAIEYNNKRFSEKYSILFSIKDIFQKL